jgi:hypothetical protein
VKLLATILACSAVFAGAAGATWPTLPTRFVSGRLATQEDLANGNAVFRFDVGGKRVTTPTRRFQIPQFAFLLEANRKRPVIVVQVELLEGKPVFGLRDAEGEMFIASADEVQLLGQTHP